MADKKRKAADSASPRPTPASTRPSQRIKPSVGLVEISADELQQPALAGVLRGLNPNNVLRTPKTQQSVELDNDDDDDDELPKPDKENLHMTRGARHGRTDKPINYDAKYHPMDEVTRLGNAARRRSGSRSVSAFRERDRETRDASVPSSARGSEDDASQDEKSSGVEELPLRNLDPKSTRHSTRAEANKAVNYSRKHHPQDDRLPGHQHKVEKLSRAMKKRKRPATPASIEIQIPRAFKNLRDGVVIRDSEDDGSDDVKQLDRQPKKPSRPHKRLRMLSDDRSSPQKSRKKRPSPKKSSKGTTQSDRIADTMQEIQDYIDDTFAGESMAQGRASSDKTEAVQNFNGLVDSADMSSSTGLDFAKAAAKQQRPIAGVDTFASDSEAEADTETEGDPRDFAYQVRSQFEPIGEDGWVDSRPRWYDDDNMPKEDDVSDGERDNPEPTALRLLQPKATSDRDTGVDDTPGSDAEGQNTEKRSSAPAPQSDTAESSGGRLTSFGRVLGADEITGERTLERAELSVSAHEGDSQEAQRNAVQRPQSGTRLDNSVVRKESSPSRTFGRSSTRVEASSSALKASSHVHQRAPGDDQQIQAEENASIGQEDDSSVDQDLENTKEAGDGGQNGSASSSTFGLAGDSEQHSAAQQGNQGPPAVKASTGQTVSPATSFDDNVAFKLTDIAMWEQQIVARSATAEGQQVRFQVSREDSCASLQSPAATPERSKQPSRPSQRILFSSDPNCSPAKESSDPASSTNSSSPSKFLDEEF